MNALKAIGWAVGLLWSIWFVFETVGLHRMVAMFPEGRRWWMFPVQIVSLAIFAAFAIFNPF